MYLSASLHIFERSLIFSQPNQYHALQLVITNCRNWTPENKVHLIQSKWIHNCKVHCKNSDEKPKLNKAQTKFNHEQDIKLRHMEPLVHFRETLKESEASNVSSTPSGSSGLASPEADVHPDVQEAKSMYEGGYRLPHPIWTDNEVSSVQITHKPPVTKVDKLAYYTVKCMRVGFDVLSGYTYGLWRGRLDEKQWIKRIIFLETVAGVPVLITKDTGVNRSNKASKEVRQTTPNGIGMVGAMVRHLVSLRRFKRDQGWIHTLLEEAENERMHLMTAMRVGNPGLIMRSFVAIAQGVFVGGFSLAYLISPRFCHRFVGYLEEEAVKTYTLCLKEIDEGRLKMWSRMKAPEIAVEYWKLPHDAMMRDVILAIRADEAHHRAVNHTLSGMKPDEQNPFPPGE